MTSPHSRNRDMLEARLVAEIAGPDLAEHVPSAREVDWDALPEHIAPDDKGPFRQAGTGEEILVRGGPRSRYGVGVLHPIGGEEGDPEAEDPEDAESAEETKSDRTGDDEAEPSPDIRALEDDRDDFDLSNANWRRPSSMSISFLAAIEDGGALVVAVEGGRYERKPERSWWLRKPVSETVECDIATLIRDRQWGVRIDGLGPLRLGLRIRSRPDRVSPAGDALHLVTVSLINETDGSHGDGGTATQDECCLFQSRFTVRATTAGGEDAIRPYPERRGLAGDREARSMALLYRHERTFAVGHGCAADWQREISGGRVSEVRAEHLPRFEAPDTDYDAAAADGSTLKAPMASLAGLADGEDGFDSLEAIVGAYEAWVADRRDEAGGLPAHFESAAVDHLDRCEDAARRMRAGMDYLRTDAQAREAFTLANHAMLLQWRRSSGPRREPDWDTRKRRLAFDPPYEPIDGADLAASDHSWRAFQIAFLLLSIPSVSDDARTDRETVELIWFPTGGGKTEAYLGLAAFHMFLRRLRDPSHAAVDVLMRYTLRLLTAQQFQRGAALLAAMEYLRRQRPEDLGEHPFSVGLWVGSGLTPNQRRDAIERLRELEKRRTQRNPFVLLRCPWCRARMGPLDLRAQARGRPRVKGSPPVLGYRQSGFTVALGCPDRECDFADGLPVLVIDEDIYEQRPSFVVATVDKLATLAWRPRARSLFGLGSDGQRDALPPGLVIQDELHLISGPLGSMVGLYEAVIEELCTYRGELDEAALANQPPVRPKIVSSTATISRYREQIQALYARPEVALFPPPGLEAGDSFFGRYARNADGSLAEGKRYVGIHAPGFGSLQALQVRAWAAVLQAAQYIDDDAERDPWWTLLIFFSSLRELGSAVSLSHSDVRDHLYAISARTGAERLRRLYRINELTGRLQDHEVPAMLESLEVSTTDGGRDRPIDVCLASSILEVGVDIDRLALMALAGQPKTTSQYIQVAGRVGRKQPGLILSLYSPTRPRDRSHFERFRSYHERLYAQVEPSSVTPFSAPALERALHAVMTIYARLTGGEAAEESPRPYPEGAMNLLRGLLEERIHAATGSDAAAAAAFGDTFDRRAREWREWERTRWERAAMAGDSDSIPLLRRSGEYATREEAGVSWATPLSMRNVDAECRGAITTLYAREASV